MIEMSGIEDVSDYETDLSGTGVILHENLSLILIYAQIIFK